MPAPSAVKTPYLFGLHVPQDNLDSALHKAEQDAGRTADVVLLFGKVQDPFNEQVAKLTEKGYQVALCLEFWKGSGGADPAFSLASIIKGDHDADFTRWLTRIAQLSKPVHLRILHEFNGDWYPWGAYAAGNKASDFIPAWRHLAGLARKVAGKKALLQLCFSRADVASSKAQEGKPSVDTFYPGDEYVDELAINAYNRPTYSKARSFEQVVGPYYKSLRAFRPHLPLWIGEVACTEKNTDKAAWITDMFHSVLTDYPVECLTWFHEAKKVAGEPDRDWPFTTSDAALKAFRAGVNLQHA